MEAKPTNLPAGEDPIAAIPSCALDEPGLWAQRERYRQLAETLNRLDRTPERILVRFDERLDRELLEQTLETERGCCPFFVFAFNEPDNSLEIGVLSPDQLPALDALAAAFAAGPRGAVGRIVADSHRSDRQAQGLSTTNRTADKTREQKNLATATSDAHHEIVDLTDPERRPQVLMVVANPTVSSTLGWPVGFWASELFHPYYEFLQRRYEVTIASPDGGRVEVDALSDPRDQSKWSVNDLISMGALNTAEITALLENTPAIGSLELDSFDAIVVCGGQAPMFQFREHEELQRAIAHFYEQNKPTAALCHGTAALLDIKLADGNWLIDGRTITGFANVEEDFSDAAVGQRVMPYRIEDQARERGANFIQAGLFKAFAVRDQGLITGQQQYSGRRVAELVIQALGD